MLDAKEFLEIAKTEHDEDFFNNILVYLKPPRSIDVFSAEGNALLNKVNDRYNALSPSDKETFKEVYNSIQKEIQQAYAVRPTYDWKDPLIKRIAHIESFQLSENFDFVEAYFRAQDTAIKNLINVIKTKLPDDPNVDIVLKFLESGKLPEGKELTDEQGQILVQVLKPVTLHEIFTHFDIGGNSVSKKSLNVDTSQYHEFIQYSENLSKFIKEGVSGESQQKIWQHLSKLYLDIAGLLKTGIGDRDNQALRSPTPLHALIQKFPKGFEFSPAAKVIFDILTEPGSPYLTQVDKEGRTYQQVMPEEFKQWLKADAAKNSQASSAKQDSNQRHSMLFQGPASGPSLADMTRTKAAPGKPSSPTVGGPPKLK